MCLLKLSLSLLLTSFVITGELPAGVSTRVYEHFWFILRDSATGPIVEDRKLSMNRGESNTNTVHT